MSTLEKIEEMWAVDCKIEEIDLSYASRQSAELHHKYTKILNSAVIKLKNLEFDRDRLMLIKQDYYLGNLDKDILAEYKWQPMKRLVLKADLPLYLNADNDVININQKIQLMTQVVKYLESIIRFINNRNYLIKNIIDHEKFINGGQ